MAETIYISDSMQVFTVDESAKAFNVPADEYLKLHGHTIVTDSGKPVTAIASGAAVISPAANHIDNKARILLLRRAAHDSMPNCWEIPGGGVDDTDETILHGVARELIEEAGLVATSIGPQVGNGHTFPTRSGKMVARFSFAVQVRDTKAVKLDPNEHSEYMWATKEECELEGVTSAAGLVTVLHFTTDAQKNLVLAAFAESRA